MQTEISITYKAGHTYPETWESTDLFCPKCGGHRVWRDAGAGDYYEGPEHLCLDCKAQFSLPRLEAAESEGDPERLAACEAAGLIHRPASA